MLDRFPERTPLLRYYDEGGPAVMDWLIHWTVEHGVGVSVFDWSTRSARRSASSWDPS